jgi:tripartite-type tricarboxylate transporter receptor subunit TctC
MKLKVTIIAAGMLFFGTNFGGQAFAQTTYPTRIVEIISTNAAGGGLDFALQLFKPRVDKILGHPLIINYIATGGEEAISDSV